jgi:opacity protein-like surface antigen
MHRLRRMTSNSPCARTCRTLLLAVLLCGLSAGAARADGLFIPFIGANFGGDSGTELGTAIDASRFNWGASIGWMGAGVIGVEGDFGYSPDFFGKTDLGGSSVLTATGNLLIGVPIGGQTGIGFRPYVLAGLGVIRSEVGVLGDVRRLDNNEAAWDFGGGAMFFLGTHVGVRTDLRYFRTFRRVDFDVIDIIEGSRRLDFARASVGFIVRF